MVEAVQVPWEDNFVSLLEKMWNEKSGTRIEVLNFGTPGAGTAAEYLALEKTVFHFSPDVILLCINPSNDIYNNSFELEGKKSKPFFVVENGRLELLPPDKVKKPPGNWLWKNAHLYRFLARRWQMKSEHRRTLDRGDGVPLPLYVFSEKKDPVWERAWKITDALIGQIAQDVRQKKITLLAILVPIELEVDFSIWERDKNLKQLIENEQIDFELPHRRILEICKKHQLPVIDLYPDFLKIQSMGKGALHYEKDGHLNPEGHRQAAIILAQGIADNVDSHQIPPTEK